MKNTHDNTCDKIMSVNNFKVFKNKHCPLDEQFPQFKIIPSPPRRIPPKTKSCYNYNTALGLDFPEDLDEAFRTDQLKPIPKRSNLGIKRTTFEGVECTNVEGNEENNITVNYSHGSDDLFDLKKPIEQLQGTTTKMNCYPEFIPCTIT